MSIQVRPAAAARVDRQSRRDLVRQALSLTATLAAATLGLAPLTGHAADNFPSRAVKVFIPSPPGGGTDTLARLLGERLSRRWGQPVVIENRGGGGGNIAGDAAAHGSPDGHVLMLAHPAPLVINKALYSRLSYDPDAFVPVSLIASVPNVLVVGMKGPTSVQGLIEQARANPDRLNYASGAIGSPSSVTPDLFKSMTGVKITGVPYQGSAPAITALLAGQVDLMFVELSTALPYIRSNKLRALAVAGAERSRFLPDTATLAETLPGFLASVWFAVVAPPHTPPALAEQISQAIAEAVRSPEMTKSLSDMSMDPVGSTPGQLAAFLTEERQRWGAVIRASGARAD
jgi:tripartite-type tricarboxylate transporter receptor subunit TctC